MNKTALKTLIQGLEHRLELAAKKKQEENDLFGQMSYHFVMAGLHTAIEDAKKLLDLEKEQIINAIKLTIEKEYTEQTWANCKSITDQAEQYYNETYKNE